MNDVAVIIPTYNEAKTIALVIDRLPQSGCDVIVVDDSTDNTAGAALRAGAACVIGGGHVRRGIGPSVRQGLYYALERYYKYIVVMDAGLSHVPELVAPLVYKARTTSCDVVIASRFLDRKVRKKTFRYYLSRCATIIYNLLMRGTCVRVTDATTSFRCYTRAAVSEILEHPLVGKYFETHPELLVVAARAGLHVCEIAHPYILTNSTFRWKMALSSLRMVWRLLKGV